MSISSIRFATNLGKYLGFPLISGRVSKATLSDMIIVIKLDPMLDSVKALGHWFNQWVTG